MFKQLQTKIMLLLAMILGGANAWAQEVVITLDNIGAELSSTANTEAATTDITATGTEDSYTLNYYQCKKQGSAMLMTKSVGAYISNHTAMPGNIKSVEVFINSGASGKTTYDCAFSATELNEATSGIGAVNITGGNSHVFSNLNNGAINVQGAYFCISLGNANNGQVLKLVITCEQGTTANLTSLTLSGTPTKTQYFEGQNFDPTGLTVTANYDDNTTSDVTSRVEWTPSPLTIGTTSVTGTYQNQTVTVNGLTVTEAPGTQDNPYTVAQALEAPESSNVYVRGIISRIYSTSVTNNGQIRYYISDDGTTENEMNIYNGKGLNGADFTSIDDIQVGDAVVIFGDISVYQNANQMAANNYIVSLQRKQVTSIALSGTYPTTFVEGSTFSHEGIVVTATYDDNSTEDVTAMATFSEPNMTQVGQQTVTVTYQEKTATYTINITALPTHTATFSIEGITSTQDFKEGAAIVFPAVSDRNGFNFVGWVTSTINGTQATAPEMVINATMGTADVTYYAVFAEGTTSTGWQKLTASEVSEAGVYAIISEDGHAFNGTMSSGHGQSTTNAFEFTNGVAESAPEGTCEMTLTVSGDGFTMYNADHGYLYATKAASGGLAWHDSETSSWSYDAEAENWVYASNGAYLRVYNNTFRTYGKSSNDPLYFAYQTEIGSFENYCTTIPTPTITVADATVNVDANEHEGTMAITYENLAITDMTDFDIQYYDSNNNELDADPSWIMVEVAEQDPQVGEGYVVSYYMEENIMTDPRSVYFKVYALHGDANEVYSNLVTITQAAASTATITLNAACTDGTLIYGTYYSDKAYVMNNMLEGQVVSVDADGKLVVQTAYEGGEVVPANTALLIATADEFSGTKEYTVTLSTGGNDLSEFNMLKGTLTADEMTTGDNCLFYRLTMHNGTQIGFWWGAADGAAFKPGANKAYLAVPAEQAKAGFAFEGGDATEIVLNALKGEQNGETYNLQGQKVGSEYKGIVIKNNKKYMVK